MVYKQKAEESVHGATQHTELLTLNQNTLEREFSRLCKQTTIIRFTWIIQKSCHYFRP